MFKKIHAAVLACSLAALPVAPALAFYDEICVFNQGAYAVGMVIERNYRGEARNVAAKSINTGRGEGAVTGQTKCVKPEEAGLRPGDSFRFMINPYGDINSKGSRFCGPNRDRARGHEGVFLLPDGQRRGRLTFKSWGTLYFTRCELEHSGTERMHSKCGATRDGMTKIGCNRFELDQEWELGSDRNGKQIARAMEQDATLGQFYDLIDRGGYNLNSALADGSTALHIAARLRRGQHIDILVERGANLDAYNDHGATPLMTALADKRFGMAEKLLNAGANPDLAREDGEFPLHYAAQQGNPEIVQLLLDNAALVNALHTHSGKSPLEVAQAREDRHRDAIVNLLIRHGAEARVHLEEIPNIIATDAGLDKLTEALDSGVDVNEATGDNLTGLHIAAAKNRGDYAEILLMRGANPDLQDEQGRTPLMTAIEANPAYPGVAQALLFEGANPNLGRRDGSFPLYLAVELVRDDIIDMLLLLGSDIHPSQRHPNTDKTALTLADELFESGRKSEHAFIRESLLNEKASR